MSPPAMQYDPWLIGMRRAMELMLTGDAMTGREAAEWGFATRAFPAADLEARTLEFAERAAKIPTEPQATAASRSYLAQFRRDGGSVRAQLDRRDSAFGDYRMRSS